MAKAKQIDPSRIHAEWPGQGGQHPVTELSSDRQGSLSPFGEVTFPLPDDEVRYVHPVTVVNR